MKLNLAPLTLLLLLLPFASSAIGAYKVGDKLNVHAASGLILRQIASPEGEKVATLAYGEVVTVMADDQPKTAHMVEEFPGYKIRGFWVKVKSQAGQEGYVFDGYLSAYHIPGTGLTDAQKETGGSVAEQYLLGKSPRKGVKINMPKVGGQYDNYRQKYKNGAEVNFAGGEGGSSQSILFEKGISIEEGYLIGKMLWLKDMKVKTSLKKGKVTVDSEDGLFQITVENRGGFTLLTMSHAD